MDWIQLSRAVTVAFAAIATALNWSELDNIQRGLIKLGINRKPFSLNVFFTKCKIKEIISSN